MLNYFNYRDSSFTNTSDIISRISRATCAVEGSFGIGAVSVSMVVMPVSVVHSSISVNLEQIPRNNFRGTYKSNY